MTLTQHRLLNDAVLYAYSSEFATQLHEGIGYALGVEVAATRHATWLELGAHVVASSLDLVDGRLKDKAVRCASKALFKEPRNNRDNKPDPTQWEMLEQHGIVDNPRADERTDKRYFYSLMSALTIRMFNNGDTRTAKSLITNMGVSKLRDDAKGGLRNYAETRGWSTNAKFFGKAKTTLHVVGISALLTPPLDNPIGRRIGTAIISAGTLAGLADYTKYISYINEQEVKPEETKIVLDDTTQGHSA